MLGDRPQLVPAIEAETVDQLLFDAGRVAQLAPLLHFDVADGELVSSSTPNPSDYPKVPDDVRIFWHLMVHQPTDYLDACLAFHTDCIAVAAEARGVQEAIEWLSQKDVKTALTLNPQTLPRQAASLIERVPVVQVMTIEPGGQGRPFEPTMLAKCDEIRSINPLVSIAVDGGVNAHTIESVVRYRPTYIAVGSALTQAESTLDAWQTLNHLVDVTMSKL